MTMQSLPFYEALRICVRRSSLITESKMADLNRAPIISVKV